MATTLERLTKDMASVATTGAIGYVAGDVARGLLSVDSQNNGIDPVFVVTGAATTLVDYGIRRASQRSADIVEMKTGLPVPRDTQAFDGLRAFLSGCDIVYANTIIRAEDLSLEEKGVAALAMIGVNAMLLAIGRKVNDIMKQTPRS